jgi:hypothetical protein
VDEGVSGLFVETVRACCSQWVLAGVAFRMLLLGSLVFACRVCLEKARTVSLLEKPRWHMVWSTQAHRFLPLSPIMPMV